MAKKPTNTTAQTEKRVAEAAGTKPLTEAEIAAAQKEGAKEDIKEAAKESHRFLTDGNLANVDGGQRQWPGSDEVMQYAGLLDLSADDLAERIDAKADRPIPEEKVAGLLALERAGQNRTDHVKLLCARLGVKSPYEVTNAGPGYTNDTTPVTAITR